MSEDRFGELLKLAHEKWLALSPEEKLRATEAQRRNWVLGQTPHDLQVEPESRQHAPRVERNTFKVMVDGNPKPVEVVHASFAACIERETNSQRERIEELERPSLANEGDATASKFEQVGWGQIEYRQDPRRTVCGSISDERTQSHTQPIYWMRTYSAPMAAIHPSPSVEDLEAQVARLEEELQQARDNYQQEAQIVARIWDMYENPSYEELEGKSIYDLIAADRKESALWHESKTKLEAAEKDAGRLREAIRQNGIKPGFTNMLAPWAALALDPPTSSAIESRRDGT